MKLILLSSAACLTLGFFFGRVGSGEEVASPDDASGNLVGKVPCGWDLQAACNPVCHRSEVLKSAIAAGSTPGELEQSVDRLNRS